MIKKFLFLLTLMISQQANAMNENAKSTALVALTTGVMTVGTIYSFSIKNPGEQIGTAVNNLIGSYLINRRWCRTDAEKLKFAKATLTVTACAVTLASVLKN